MNLEDRVTQQVEANRGNASPTSQNEPEQSNGVKSYAKATVIVALLIAACFAFTGSIIPALYIAGIGISASILFFALGAVVDRLNDIIKLLGELTNRK